MDSSALNVSHFSYLLRQYPVAITLGSSAITVAMIRREVSRPEIGGVLPDPQIAFVSPIVVTLGSIAQTPFGTFRVREVFHACNHWIVRADAV